MQTCSRFPWTRVVQMKVLDSLFGGVFCTPGPFQKHLAPSVCNQLLTQLRAVQAVFVQLLLLPSFVFDASSSFMPKINIVLFCMCHFSKFKAFYGLTVFAILYLFLIFKAAQKHWQCTLTLCWHLQWGKEGLDLCCFLSWTYKWVLVVSLPKMCLQCLN